MEILLKKLGISIDHLKCLDEVFRRESDLYLSIENKMISEMGEHLISISRELYAGGKKQGKFNRQMILGDVIEYIFTGRAYYYASVSGDHFNHFAKLVLYCVNQLLLFDTITINPAMRKHYIELLEQRIEADLLYERDGDQELAEELKDSDVVIWGDGWKKFDNLVDSILPKTLGCPKELVVFLELVRSKKGLVIPLLLTQRLLGGASSIAPPDFLILNRNKEIFGVELGYAKEGQSREFSMQTSIPTFAVDLANHMHNRCPRCGENILYCDTVIEKYSNGALWNELDSDGRFRCTAINCGNFSDGKCKFANYYGKYKGDCFYGPQNLGDEAKKMHYHAECVKEGVYEYRGEDRKILEHHQEEFFSQIPEIEGIDNLYPPSPLSA